MAYRCMLLRNQICNRSENSKIELSKQRLCNFPIQHKENKFSRSFLTRAILDGFGTDPAAQLNAAQASAEIIIKGQMHFDNKRLEVRCRASNICFFKTTKRSAYLTRDRVF